MRKTIIFFSFTLALILFLTVISLIVPDTMIAADISDDILAEYQSLLDYSITAVEEGDLSEAEMSLEEASLLLWNNMPLKADNITFVKRQPGFYGDIVPVEDKIYHPGDRVFLYLEPKNYLLNLDEEGKYEMDIVLGAKLIFEDGTVVFHDSEFLRFQKVSSRPNREIMFDMYFGLVEGMNLGEYVIKLEIVDMLSGEQIEVETEFELEN